VDTLPATSSDSTVVGGLVGQNNKGLIADSFAVGKTIGGGGDSVVGGLVGNNNEASISNSYAKGSVSSNVCDECGGIVGTNSGSISSSYSTALLNVSRGQVGGLIGDDEPDDLTNDYWDLETSGITDPSQGAGNVSNDPGITGLTDAQLKSGLPAGFDLTIWAQSPDINNGYPYLLANPPPK
jgi:hypothetical protein